MVTTRGERMLALRKARMAASPPFLRGGFRPFFLGGALWAVAALALWLLALVGGAQLPSAFDPLAWHRHEMLFGFVGAVVAGFLLAAIPNWTGRLPIAGWPLALLFLLWVAGRGAVLFSAHTGRAFAAAVDVAFYLILAAAAGREVIAAKNRNLPIVLLLVLFGAANAADHAAVSGLIADGQVPVRAAIALVVMMISLIGGRIIPSFTRNWLVKQGAKHGLPGQPTRYDMAVLVASAGVLSAWIVYPGASAVGWLMLVIGLMQAVRLTRWSGLRTLSDPLVLVLHVGYAWLPAGLLLLGAATIDDRIPLTAAIHALTAGAMATMILAVMSRATLGHTGRPLVASGATVAMYVLITIGAVLRVAVPLLSLDYRLGMEIAGLAWGAAFLVFLMVYGPMLLAPRVDDPSK